MFAAELARRHPNIKTVSVHPGLIMTDLYASNKKSNALVRYGTAIVGPLVMSSVAQGAHNTLWAAAGAKRDELVDGAYYTPVGRAHKGNKWAKNRESGQQLWDWTEKELGKLGYGA